MSDKYPGGFVTAGAPAGFSVVFDGSGDSLSVPSNAAWQFDSGNFTVEAWVYFNSVGNAQFLTCPVAGGLYWQYFSGALDFGNNAGGSVQAAWSPVANTWYHLAAVRNGGTFTNYINGVVHSSGSAFNVTATTTLGIGAGGAGSFNGYMSNLRIVKGTAVYTTAFTPPTQLFAVSGTSLLTCQSPTIIDNSTNAFTVTANGDAKVSNFTPFAGYTGFNPALGAAAGGVWTLDEAAYYQQNRIWPIYDPYFNQTTLMLHGNGTNGAQNNTFLDSSTNNFTITRNGNTTQGSFTPFSQTGWSNYFDGSSSIQVPSATYLQLSTATTFTFEAWIYPLSLPGDSAGIIGKRSGGTIEWQFFLKSTGQIGVYPVNSGNSVYSGTPVALNTWTHVAFSWNTNTARFFINGVLTSSTTAFTMDSSGSTAPVSIGATNPGSERFTGYISNARVVKGTAVYTSSFTPSTIPLTAITNTSLLSCQTNSFLDTSANNQAFTTVGTPSVQAFSPFVPAYITPTTYSNFFDGNGDYLNFTGNSNTSIGGNNWTVEAWVYITSASQQYQQVLRGQTSNEILLMIETTNTRVQCEGTGGTATSPATFQLNTWNHCAAVRNGSTVTVYLNGIGGTPVTMNPATTTSEVFRIGTDTSPSRYLSGCISNLRMVVGTAVYTSNFTPPTAPLTAISGTGLLTCQSSTFVDNSTNNFTLTANGNVQPVTSPAPFPANVDTTTLNSAYSTSLIGGSAYFDGTTDYLNFTDASNALDLGGRAASIEAWVYPTSTAGAQHFLVKTGGDFSWNTTSGIEYAIAFDVNKFYFVYNVSGNATFINGATTRARNQWYHVVVATDASNNIALFVNGVRDGTATNAISKPTNRTLMYVGANSGGTETLTGYVSGERFISGSGAYDPTKTVVDFPITPPTAVSGTQLLLNFTNGAIFDNTAKVNLETIGNAQISTTQSKYGGSSMYFDGSSSLSSPSSTLYAFNTGDLTIEAWIYFNSVAACTFATTNVASGFYWQYNSSQLQFGRAGGGTNIGSAWSPSANTWYHIATVRSGNTVTNYVNGVSIGSGSFTDSISATTTLQVGTGGAGSLNGYIDDLRITRGYARYVANFTPPTSQLQDQ